MCFSVFILTSSYVDILIYLSVYIIITAFVTTSPGILT